MKLNFRYVPAHHFLVAIDRRVNDICGFSVIGKKGKHYKQLLSAVQQAYRGQGVYGALTSLLSQTLPQDATLLNVTHADNRAMQKAYRRSGRVHLVDTVVLRN